MEYKEINGKYYSVLETESFILPKSVSLTGTERIYVLKDDFGDITFTILSSSPSMKSSLFCPSEFEPPYMLADITQLLDRLETIRKMTWRNHDLKEHRIKTIQWGISRIQEQKREEKLDELLNPKKENVWHFA
jgi:hypothetical protein